MRVRRPASKIERTRMFIALALVLFLLLPDPWDVIGALASLACGIVEVTYWQRRMRRVKVETGVEQLVGSIGEVTAALAPVGQVRVLGELWQARAGSELPRGTPVRVVGVDGLMLDVEPADSAPGPG
jgi:membrane-bound serine protease (ClpP class)